MRIIPVLFPTDLGAAEGTGAGLRGAPDVLLDQLEGEGARFGRPIAVPVPPRDGLAEDGLLAAVADAAAALAQQVHEVNSGGDFPLVLGGDHTALIGHVLAHGHRHPGGFGLAILADARLDIEGPSLARSALGAVLRRHPTEGPLATVLAGSKLDPSMTTVAGGRGRDLREAERVCVRLGVEVWSMERLELEGERAYRSMLERHLSRGPIALSVDLCGIDPHLMPAVNDPVADGLDWSFLKRSLEQCLPHLDRVLGLDLCELDPLVDQAGSPALVRLAEAVAPFLRKMAAR